MTRTLRVVAAVLTVVLWAAAPAAAGDDGDDGPALSHCIGAEEAAARAAGEDEDAPPKFTPAFFARPFTIDASLDGLEGKRLPIAIEEVCDIPAPLARQAAQLAGADGIALVSETTRVWLDRKPVYGKAAARALEGADTAVLRVRLLPARRWSRDEDGGKIPTFKSRRIVVTD